MKKLLFLFLLLTGTFITLPHLNAQTNNPSGCNPQKCECGDKCPETCINCQGHGCVNCELCNGKGWTMCATCNGQGVIIMQVGDVKTSNTCVSCHGRGWNGCDLCGGGGETAGTGRHRCSFCGGWGCICPK